MNTDVSITLSGGLPFDQAGITGVSISYGFNMIPSAMISLNVPYISEKFPEFFTDPTKYKVSTKNANPVVINIKSRLGCLTFKGYFDGLSIVQTPGGMDYTAIIKNKFQILTELYPKLMGMYPGSMYVGKMSPALRYSGSTVRFLSMQVGGQDIPANVSPTEFYRKYLSLVIKSQQNTKDYTNIAQDISALRTILDDTNYRNNLTLCDRIINNDLDLTYSQTPDYFCNNDLNYHANLLANGGDDAWSLLLNVMNEAGCVLLASSEKLYIVPQTNFLLLQGKCPNHEEQSILPNQAYPADYSNFVLNDNSYKNIKYCIISALSELTVQMAKTNLVNMHNLGVYPSPNDHNGIPDDGSSGILFTYAPPWLANPLHASVALNNTTTSANQTLPLPISGNMTDLAAIAAAQTAIRAIDESLVSQYGKDNVRIRNILNNHAKARFLTEKYSDRTGSFSLQFNPRWVPGTTGFLASRQPKVMFNFYVTGVNHNIVTHGGKSGTASTQISFNSARYGGSVDNIPSVSQNELYHYTSNEMKALQSKWLSDNNATYNPVI
jgi:hypothetical protein